MELSSHITLTLNVVNVNIEHIPQSPEPITDPARLLPDKYRSETAQEIIARTQKDPWLSYKEVAEELKVSPQTIKKYCKYGFIEGEHDGKYDQTSLGWFIRKSEVERIKSNSNWLKEFQELARNKPIPDPTEITYKKRVRVLLEIEALRKFREPLNPGYIVKNHQWLYSMAKRYYGSWYKAIKICGINPSQVYMKWDKAYGFKGRKPIVQGVKHKKAESLLRKINKMFIDRQLNIENRRELDYEVYAYLGGWKEVYKLLGLKTFDKANGKNYRIWTRENIIEEIKKLHSIKAPLNYSFMYKHNRALLKAAEKQFQGSWATAVRSANLDYGKIRLLNEWTGKKIICAIKELFDKGSPLNNLYMRNNNLPLLSSAEKIFGSWRRAIEESGIDYSAVRKRTPHKSRLLEHRKVSYVQERLLPYSKEVARVSLP